MKILVIPSWFASERNKIAGIFVSEQCKMLIRMGLDVHILFADFHPWNIFNSKTWYSHFEDLENEVPVYRFYGFAPPKLNMWLTKLWCKLYLKAFRKYLQNNAKPDLIHAHSYFAGYIAMQIKEIYGIPYVITEHHSGFMDQSIPSWQISLTTSVFKKANEIIAVSNSLRAKLSELTNRNIYVISNLVLKAEGTNSEIELKTDKFNIISVGSLIQRKGYDSLIKAIDLLLKKLELKNLVQVYLIGEGKQKKTLQRMIAQSNLESHIHLLGALPHNQVIDFYKKSQLFVSTSHVETQGVAVLEALCNGLPVVATFNECMVEIIDETNGIMVPINDELRLADSIKLVIENHSKYNKLNIGSSAISKYGPETIGPQLLKIYTKILGK